MKQRITLKLIAEKAGVNQATVSRALNPETASLISEKVRNDIQKICDEYGFRPSLRGKSIVTGKTFKIGMILGSMQKDFAAHDWARIICSLSSELQKHNYALTILHADGTESMDKQVKNFLMSGVADGYVTGPSLPGNEVFSLLKKLSLPLWTVCESHNRNYSINHILRDDTASMTEIWRNMPKDCRPGCAYFSKNTTESAFRMKNIYNAAKNAFPDEDYHIEKICFEHPSAFSGMEYRDALQSALANIEKLKKFKFIWCESDFIAHALCDALMMNKIKAGSDIQIVGYGDFETYTNSTAKPFLSTISANTETIGRELGKALIAEINGDTPMPTVVKSTFISRNTFNF